MKRSCLFIVLLFVGLFSGCCKQQIATEPQYSFIPPKLDTEVSYSHHVKPILEKRCVVCHSCYNSPCQLKFSSWEGVERGASKEQVYNADRLSAMEPSRLFIDAQNSAEWREKGFYSVKPDEEGGKYDDSIMFLLLDHKRRNPSLVNSCSESEHFKPEEKDLACPKTTAEVNDYLKKHPNRGMPFGFPPLSQDEFGIVVEWLKKGAPGPTPGEQDELKAVPDEDSAWITKWEDFLNNPDPQYRLTARYLYEHLFLAHINFRPDSEVFYTLVRSKTPPGDGVKVIATRRPYDDPGTPDFYYRFRKVHSTLVHKTHMVFTMDNEQFDLVKRLFIKTPWDSVLKEMNFDEEISANPFVSFKSIPVKSRYEWLLANAHYVIMTFIRGPVCKGQVALNVINDHFWLMFMDPQYDVSVKDPEFLYKHSGKLRMPAEKGSDLSGLRARLTFMKTYWKWVLDYYQARQDRYADEYPDGLGAEMIWVDPKGKWGEGLAERELKQSMLTVFRHFDSASVHRGAIGKLPKTVWVVDYPIMERIYYALVAGFDVYGSRGHQGATRKYMDSLRIESESAFLEFMPPASRRAMMDSWYQKLESPDDLFYYPTDIPAKFPFSTAGRDCDGCTNELFKQELLESVVEKMGLEFDSNYLQQREGSSGLPDAYGGIDDWVRGFKAVSAKEGSFIKRMADHNANVAWVKVVSGAKINYFSVLVDRWHDNVNYREDEDLRLDPSKDQADILPGLWGSYPNYFFVVDEDEIGRFFQILYEYDGSSSDICRLEIYGVNRAEPDFWTVYDEFQDEFDRQHDERRGRLDLNRYYSLAMQKMLYGGGTEDECAAIAVQLQKDKRWWQ